MKQDNRAVSNAVSPIPVSYIEVMYIRLHNYGPYSSSLCSRTSLCSNRENG
jgi:hypothetical protein